MRKRCQQTGELSAEGNDGARQAHPSQTEGHYSPFATFSYRLNFLPRTSIFQAVIGQKGWVWR
jgi:hypothetical protein